MDQETNGSGAASTRCGWQPGDSVAALVAKRVAVTTATAVALGALTGNWKCAAVGAVATGAMVARDTWTECRGAGRGPRPRIAAHASARAQA